MTVVTRIEFSVSDPKQQGQPNKQLIKMKRDEV